MIFNVKNINYYVNFYNDLVSVSREDYVLYFTVIRSLAIVNYGELNVKYVRDSDRVSIHALGKCELLYSINVFKHNNTYKVVLDVYNLNIYDKDIVTLLVKQYKLWLDVEKETGLTTNDLRQLLETLRGKDNA